jgi:YbbR domain-containing protein
MKMPNNSWKNRLHNKLSSQINRRLSSDESFDMQRFIFDNFAYKIVSLFVALVLWLAILGRRDFVSTREVELLFTPAKGHMILSQSAEKIKVKISGSQAIIKKNRDRLQSILIDVSTFPDGIRDIDISNQNFDLPPGIKVLGLRPNVVKIEISSK